MSAELFYGFEGDELLTCEDVEEVVERTFENACVKVGESFDVIADRIDWPLRVLEFQRADVTRELARLTDRVAEEAYELLGEEYDNPDGDPQEPTEAVKAAARTFAEVVCREFVPWACEPTGKVVEVTREEAKEMVEL